MEYRRMQRRTQPTISYSSPLSCRLRSRAIARLARTTRRTAPIRLARSGGVDFIVDADSSGACTIVHRQLAPHWSTGTFEALRVARVPALADVLKPVEQHVTQ